MNVVRFALGLAVVVAATCSSLAVPALAADRVNPLRQAKSWAFQLKNLGPDQQARIAASPYDLVVIDSERFPQEQEIPLTREEVERMKVKPDGSRRLVIAYFSVGEAESYRYYWKPEWKKHKPSWVGKENKQWPENFLVQYWQPGWQNIVFGSPESFADRVINSGFDGFYIDRVDAYYYFGDTKEKRDKMASFIEKLAKYIRSKKSDAVILAQNAEELLDRPDYLDAIDGVAKEDLIYGISHTEKLNPRDDIDYSSGLLKGAHDKGKAIFVIEYLANAANIASAKKRIVDQLGFVLYVGPRGLFEIPPPGSDVITAATAGSTTGGELQEQQRAAASAGKSEPAKVGKTGKSGKKKALR
jgi:cysteinyl-tRNA synthetase